VVIVVYCCSVEENLWPAGSPIAKPATSANGSNCLYKLTLRSIAVFWWRVARLRLHIQVKKEAELLSATQCWGTNGKYVKKAQLLGFVEELGLDDAMATAVMQHAIEEDVEEGRKAEPDMTALAVICGDVIRSA